MLKFIRGKGQHPSAERQKIQNELFAFRKTVQHGFPNKPTCLAWDPILRLMAIGTASGAIKVLGQPGVEFYGHHSTSDIGVIKLIFIPNQGRVVSLCEDNSLHLWEINGNALEEVKTHSVEGKLKKVSALCLEGSQEHLLLGTEGGNVYLLNLNTFEMAQTIIYQDVVMQNVPEDYKINPGAVETMAIQPDNPDHLLIGYNRGLMVLWHMKTPAAKHTYISTRGVECLCWKDSRTFVSSHNDGTYAVWSVDTGEHEEPISVYGPLPCKPITKIIAMSDGMLVFSGGLLRRSSYSDRYTISVVDDGRLHLVLDFTSKVIDFFIAPSGEDNILIVLAEEELVAIQLNAEDWPMLQLPYLVSLHASAVTCSTYVSDVPQTVWDNIVAAGRAQVTGTYTSVAWPIDGGRLLDNDGSTKRRELLVTGHEDGSVRLWDVSDVTMTPLFKFSSTNVLCIDDDDVASPDHNDDMEGWIPFKKVGSFDPYSDDPRLAVKKISLCPETGTLVVAGTAGHVIIAKLSDGQQTEPKVVTMNIVSSRDSFVWKGHGALNIRNKDQLVGSGFVVSSVLQLHPPAAVTALALHSSWGLVAVGTAHGIAVYDFIKTEPVIVKCTLNPLDMSGAGEGPISRRKSFKKSLRESFRRLRKGRSQRGGGGGTHTDKRGTSSSTTSPPPAAQASSSPGVDVETKPVERAIEARPVDDALGSMVRCLTFARTYIISIQNMTPTLWVGTNNGTVYIFTIAIPGGSKRKEDSVSCLLGKEIQLKHRAPVIGISLMDGHCNSVDTSRHSEHPPPHKVLICSEEQIKVFTVPQLKPVCKMKLTAMEGARVRRTVLALFKAIGNPTTSHIETCLVCLTNLGDIIVLSLPDLRRQVNAAVIRKEDINGIFSLCFTERGEALYLHSSSELQRVSMSTTRLTEAKCRLDLPPGVRPTSNEDNASHKSTDTDSIASSESSSSSSSSERSQEGDKKEEQTKNDEAAAEPNKSEIKENGVSDSAHDLTMSSAGDITIDSVKDHLTNNVANNTEERTEVVRNETVKTESSVITKTTVISSSESVITQVVTPPAISQPSETDSGTEDSQQSATSQVRKAPLARMEDMDSDSVVT